MKKVITALFIAALVSVHGFALEFILTPTIGYSNLGFLGRTEKITISGYSSHADVNARVSSSVNAMSIGLAMGTIAKNGFTFMWNNDIAPLGSGTGKVNLLKNGPSALPDIDLELAASLKKGIAFEQSFILGRTFRAVDDKLYINVGSGLAWGAAKINMKKELAGITVYSEDIYDFNVGVPLQVGFQYFFTKNIGLNAAVSDVIAFGFGTGHKIPGTNRSLFQYGFENVFTA